MGGWCKLMLMTALVLIIGACRPPVSQELPTLVPSATQQPPTGTPTATHTPSGPTPTEAYVPQTIANDPAQQVYLRVIHAAADVPAVDVYVEMLAIATNLNFGQNTEPSGIVAGDYMLRVAPAGHTPTDSPLLEEAISLQGGQSLMLLLSGTPDALTLNTIPEPNDPLSRGESRLTLVNALADGIPVLVREGSNNLIPATNGGQVSTPIQLSSGRTSLDFVSGTTTLASQQIDLRDQHNHILVLVGRSSDVHVVSFNSQAPSVASVRFVNASLPIGPVDVYLNDQRMAEGAAFARPSENQVIIAQVYNLDVYAAGAERSAIEPLVRTQLVANLDDLITVILVGPPEGLRLLEYREDSSPTPADETRIAFVNTLNNVPTVQLDTIQGRLEDITSLNYAQTPIAVPIQAGEYSFNWDDASGNLVEIAENLQLEAGRSYLYLFTGRMDNAPVVISSNVGIDETLPSAVVQPSGNTATEVVNTPTEIRFVNAISGDLAVDFSLDQTILAAGLTYAQGSDLTEITRGDHTVTVTLPETTNVVATSDLFFDSSRYSVFASGFGADSVRLLIIADYPLIFDGHSPHVRLVNLSNNTDVHLGLAYSPPTTGAPPSNGMSVDSSDLRRTIPFGLQRTVDDTQGQGFSAVVLMPTGAFDIYVIDSSQNAIAATIPNFTLEAGVHYDVIAYQEGDTQRVHAFVLEYPARSG